MTYLPITQAELEKLPEKLRGLPWQRVTKELKQ